MIFEDLGTTYALENRLIKKMDFFVKMVTRQNHKQDVVLIVHGGTGEGKTNTSVVLARYFQNKTNRPIHFFFRLEPLIEFAKSTDNKIIIWDEPSLDSLSTDQLSRINKDLIRLLNTMRKKRHIVIINLTKFWKFPEALVVDRALALIHMHSNEGKDVGRFLYIRRKKLEQLWRAYHSSHQRLFGKLKAFGGRFPEIMERVASDKQRCFDKIGITINDISNATYDDYDKLKDEAIESIRTDGAISKRDLKMQRDMNTIKYCRYAYWEYLHEKFGITQAQYASDHQINIRTLQNDKNIQLKDTNLLGKPAFDGFTTTNNNTRMAKAQENQNVVPKSEEISPISLNVVPKTQNVVPKWTENQIFTTEGEQKNQLVPYNN